MTESQSRLVEAYGIILERGDKYDNRKLQSLAATFGITDKTTIKESAELAVVLANRNVAHNEHFELRERFERILELYQSQVNSSHRTYDSVRLQQYSTPGTIGFLASAFVASGNPEGYFLEPSAGNGSLTAAMKPEQVHVNEVDKLRRSNLESQGYAKVTGLDASAVLPFGEKQYDGMITNPPFGRAEMRKYGLAKIKFLEQQMALEALAAVKDNGRAAIIIGGHTNRNDKGMITLKDKPFYAYLYHHYNVVADLNISGDLYSRMGTKFDIRLLLIDGRKAIPEGLYEIGREETVITDYQDLYEIVAPLISDYIPQQMSKLSIVARAMALKLEILAINDGLGLPYVPTSKAESFEVETPDSMAWNVHQAVARVDKEVGGMDGYVMYELEYSSKEDLYAALSAEQIDAVGLAIHNMKEGTGLIVGDQTGIGKGRIASSIIRYGVLQGKVPIFLTISDSLFTDIHRDLVKTGSPQLRPFIVNGRKTTTHVKNSKGKIVYKGPTAEDLEKYLRGFIGEDQDVIAEFRENYDYIAATYTQFASEQVTLKQRFLEKVAKDNYMILDESHSSSGATSATGQFFMRILEQTRGVLYLSATFAKSPKNLPLYALKTSMRDATLSAEELVWAIEKGGVAMQEIISANLVQDGQMIRRERTFKDIDIKWLTLSDKRELHRKQADAITDIVRDIIYFQKEYVKPLVEDVAKGLRKSGEDAGLTKGTNQAGVDSQPYFSKIFQVINQMLFAIKAEDIAERAIKHLQEGKKVVVAFSSTFESFLENLPDLDTGNQAVKGSRIRNDFSQILQRGLDGVMRYSATDMYGNTLENTFLEVQDLSPEGGQYYYKIKKKIKQAATGITLAPIDVITKRIKDAGFTVGEVTGRKQHVKLGANGAATIQKLKKATKTDNYQQFQNNHLDAILINSSGATGQSAHAEVTDLVPREEVKQRVMIIGQFELDISIETQKRGRIYRTGQVLPPIYEYIVSDIPAEQRLVMMLQRKLKSLDANTSSNQKNSKEIMDEADFLNKYGDEIVEQYLKENPGLAEDLGDPLNEENEEAAAVKEPALKVSGRVATLPTEEQERFYEDVLSRYNAHIQHLKNIDEYDLEVEDMPLDAETLERAEVVIGKTPRSVFGSHSYLEKCRVKVLKKPFTKDQIKELIAKSLKGEDPKEKSKAIIEEVKAHFEKADAAFEEKQEKYFERKIQEFIDSPKLKKIKEDSDREKAIMDGVELLLNEKKSSIHKQKVFNKETRNMLMHFFDFFKAGTGSKYTTQDGVIVDCVAIGWKIDEKRGNRFAPSAISFDFALANGIKHLTIPASQYNDLNAIAGYYMQADERKAILEDWDSLTKEAAADYTTRNIITGNLLQAYGQFRGKLISYTKKGGGTGTGILLPENFDTKYTGAEHITLPIIMALPFIKNLEIGDSIKSTDGAIDILRQKNGFKLLAPASRTKGGKFYMDDFLNMLVIGGRFEKSSNFFVGLVEDKNIDNAVFEINRIGAAVEIAKDKYDKIKDTIEDYKPKEVIDLPHLKTETEEVDEVGDLALIKIKAKALALKIKILNLNL